MPNDGEVATQNNNQQQNPISVESQIVNAKLQKHSEVKLQNTENAHSDSKNCQHEGNEEVLDENMHEDSDFERNDMQTRKELVLAKYVRRHHLAEQIIGNTDAEPMTRNRLRNESFLLSQLEPKTIKGALEDVDQCEAMEEEIDQVEKNKTWSLVPRVEDKNVIGTKWVFKNKKNENGEIKRNKARLVCKGSAQKEGIDYGGDIFPYCKIGRSKNLTCLCYIQRIQSLLDGC